MSFEFISSGGALVTFLDDTGTGLTDKKTKQYAKIVACVAVLYGDIEDDIRHVWALELNKLLEEVEADAAQEKVQAASAALDPKNKKIIQPKVHPNLQRKDVFVKAQVGGISFHESANSLLKNVRKRLILENRYEKYILINYVMGIINRNQWEKIIRHFMEDTEIDFTSETTDTTLLTCPDCGRVWDGFAQCFPCEPPTPVSSVEVSEVSEASEATSVEEETSSAAVASPVPFQDFEGLPGFKDPQDFFEELGRAQDDDAAWERVHAALM